MYSSSLLVAVTSNGAYCGLQGKAYPIRLGPPPPAVNDARVATVLELQECMPCGTGKIGTELAAHHPITRLSERDTRVTLYYSHSPKLFWIHNCPEAYCGRTAPGALDFCSLQGWLKEEFGGNDATDIVCQG